VAVRLMTAVVEVAAAAVMLTSQLFQALTTVDCSGVVWYIFVSFFPTRKIQQAKIQGRGTIVPPPCHDAVGLCFQSLRCHSDLSHFVIKLCCLTLPVYYVSAHYVYSRGLPLSISGGTDMRRFRFKSRFCFFF